jgi:hypothetical protein
MHLALVCTAGNNLSAINLVGMHAAAACLCNAFALHCLSLYSGRWPQQELWQRPISPELRSCGNGLGPHDAR